MFQHSQEATRQNTNSIASRSQDIRPGGRSHHPHTMTLGTKSQEQLVHYIGGGADLTEKIVAMQETWSRLTKCTLPGLITRKPMTAISTLEFHRHNWNNATTVGNLQLSNKYRA